MIILPAASHSGWEDHMQSDQYHYLHHRSHLLASRQTRWSGFLSATTETAGHLLTRSLVHSETSWQRKAQAIAGVLRRRFRTQFLLSISHQVDKRSASAHDAKASLLSPPDPGFAIYMLLNLCIWVGLWFAVTKQHGLDNLSPHHIAFLVSVGPLILAQVICNFSYKSSIYTLHKSWDNTNYGAGDGQPDGQVEAVDDLPVPQGGLEDDEWAPDHIMDGNTIGNTNAIGMYSIIVTSWFINRSAIGNHWHVSSDESSIKLTKISTHIRWQSFQCMRRSTCCSLSLDTASTSGWGAEPQLAFTNNTLLEKI